MKFISQFYTSHKKEALLFLLMLVLELVMIFALWQRSDLNIFLRSDANEFQSIVKNLISHKIFSSDSAMPLYPTNFRTPIYPFWLTIIYLIFDSFKPAIFIGAAIFALSAPLVYLIGKEIFSEKIAFWSAVLFAVEPWALFQSGFLVAEQIFMPLFLLSIFLFSRYLRSENRPYLYLAFFILAITALTRPLATFFIIIFLLISFIVEFKYSLNRAIKIPTYALLLFLLVLSPWLIRNKIVLNTWQISSISDVNLYVENYAMLQKYLGKMKPDEDINEVGRILLGTKNYEEAKRAENARILAGVALEEIKENRGSYIIMHIKALPGFIVRNSYGNLFLDLKIKNANVQSKIAGFLSKKDFSESVNFVKNIAIGSKFLLVLFLFWPVIIIFAIAGVMEGFKNYRRNLLFWFLILWLLYFLALAGNLRDISRYKLTINAPLFMFAALGFYNIYNLLRKCQRIKN